MIKKLFAHANRGILLDVIVFLVNVVLMTILSRQLANLLHQANTNSLAQAAVAVFCLGLVFLQPIGAILKRRRAHVCENLISITFRLGALFFRPISLRSFCS